MAWPRTSAWEGRRRSATRVLIAVATLIPSVVAAQATGRIRGRITEPGTQRPVADVQVMVTGSTLGALSSASGEYVIANVPAGTQTLQVRRIGYARATRTVTVPTGGEVRADFTISPAASQLEAVVVTGTAGAVEKRTVGNAVTQVDVSDITSRTNVTDVTEVLQARSPGVQIAAGSGTPGTAADIRIRGASSFTVTRPVVFIDGVRMSTAGLGNFDPSGQGLAANSGGQTANALGLVAPQDIESIEVIKGPAAATLYGADAAGGVIQIITKKGTRGQQRVRWNARVEMGQNDLGAAGVELPINYTTCDATRTNGTTAQRNAWPGCYDAAGNALPVGTVLSGSPIRDDPNALRDGAVRRYSLSLRGGGDRFSYYVSGDQDYEEGVLANSFNRRNSARSNFTFTPSEKADFAINLGLIDSRLRLPLGDESAQGILFSSQRARPGAASTLGEPMQGWFTILPWQSNEYNNQSRNSRVTLATTVNYQPLRWFRNRLTAGLDWGDGLATIFAPPTPGVASPLTGDSLGLTAQRRPRNTIYTLDYSGTVERSFLEDFVSTSSIGSQVVASRSETLVATGRGLGSPDVTVIGSTTQVTADNSFSENNSVGYYIQEQVGWKNRLFVTGAVRADDNSSFGEDFDVIVYPKASLAWVLSEEPALQRFFSLIRADNFKFRTAWGQAGKAPAPFSATRTYTISSAATGGGSVSALRTGSYGNPGLKSERGEELEVGFDAEFLQGRIGAEFTYYDKKMRDVLFSQSVAPSSGFRGGVQTNLGRTTNSGIELGLTASPVRLPSFDWQTRVSLATNHNKLITFGAVDAPPYQVLSGSSYGFVQRLQPGYPIAGYWGREVQRRADGSIDTTATGAAIYRADTSYIGPSTPTREIAFSNTFTILRDFQLYALLDYKGGHYNYRGAEAYRCGSSQNCKPLNDPSLSRQESAPYRGAAAGSPWATYIYKADFVKLRDVSLTYTVPQRVAALARAEGMSVTLAGHNLALWSDYPGPDPEVNTYGNRAFIRGDIYSMPMTRRLTAALNLTF